MIVGADIHEEANREVKAYVPRPTSVFRIPLVPLQ